MSDLGETETLQANAFCNVYIIITNWPSDTV